MATYRTIQLSFWTDSKVDDEFTPEDKYFFLYLLTNPHTNICGCYEVSMSAMVRETGYNEATVKRLLERMEKVHGCIKYDPNTKEILINKWGKYNWSDSAATKAGIAKVAQHIKSDSFREEFTSLGFIGPPEGACRGPIDPPEASVTVLYSDTTDTHTSSSVDNSIETVVMTEFDIFWSIYPRRVGKGEARRALARALKKTDFQTIMDALNAQKQSSQWGKDGGAFIPYPATWLNQERWADEVDNPGGNEDGNDNIRNLFAHFKEEE